MAAFEDLMGRTFGRWVVLRLARKGTHKTPSYWLCKCACGNKKTVAGKSLKSGYSKSCGCLKNEFTSRRFSTHGLSRTPEYSSWKNMVNRCNNPRTLNYHRYGGRGIKICDRWNPVVGGTFENFLEDMRQKPSPQHTIEREDGNGNYEPSNCKWVTRADQAHNTSRVKLDMAAAVAIRQMSKAGASNRMIATHFGISYQTARRVVSGERWLRGEHVA